MNLLAFPMGVSSADTAVFIKDNFSETAQLALMFQAVESARNGVVLTDPNRPDNPIIYSNPAFSELTGYSAEEILGRNCRFLQGLDCQQASLDEIRLAIKARKAATVVLKNYKKDGASFYNELTISPVRDEHGKLIAFVGIQNDITARIEAEKRISDFYSIVSHELRTPIAKIKSALTIVSEGEAGSVSEKARRFVSISLRAADSLWRLIENILDFKKLESGKFRLLRERLALSQLVESTVAEFEPLASNVPVSLECQCLANPTVQVDGQRLVQVIENLLSNAIKFSQAGSAVTIKVSSDGRWARVAVADNGPGIEAHDIPKLFDKFQQLETPDRRRRGGTGLGLAVCKAIIEAHGGKIGVESLPGQGSTFWFEVEQLD